MNKLIFPEKIEFIIEGLDDHWLRSNPLLFQVKTFAPSFVIMKDKKINGRLDYILSPLIIQDSIEVFKGAFLDQLAYITRDLSGMEYLPVDEHFSLVEIQLMQEQDIKGWERYLNSTRQFFAYESLLGKTATALEIIQGNGNDKITYYEPLQKIRDIWDNKNKTCTYEFKTSLQKKY